MRPSTKEIILAALRGDESVPKDIADAIDDLLHGRSNPATEKPLLLNAKQAAKLLGIGRTSFWEISTADQKLEKRRLPRSELKPGYFLYRRKDIEAYADSMATDASGFRKQKNQQCH